MVDVGLVIEQNLDHFQEQSEAQKISKAIVVITLC